MITNKNLMSIPCNRFYLVLILFFNHFFPFFFLFKKHFRLFDFLFILFWWWCVHRLIWFDSHSRYKYNSVYGKPLNSQLNTRLVDVVTITVFRSICDLEIAKGEKNTFFLLLFLSLVPQMSIWFLRAIWLSFSFPFVSIQSKWLRCLPANCPMCVWNTLNEDDGNTKIMKTNEKPNHDYYMAMGKFSVTVVIWRNEKRCTSIDTYQQHYTWLNTTFYHSIIIQTTKYFPV